ncbi:hypothetical protein DERF_002940 [Dermatophagoides farinae]|uniref:Uncharacterized protein n=1 Tax=Dermatophagoides farinae TaxID=6954 RepID=A0A922LCA2_DERFA|nr:hypothetical protein DERF_002940 [Dermatophagoides farinae]
MNYKGYNVHYEFRDLNWIVCLMINFEKSYDDGNHHNDNDDETLYLHNIDWNNKPSLFDINALFGFMSRFLKFFC